MKSENIPLLTWIEENGKSKEDLHYSMNVGNQFVIRLNPIIMDPPQESLIDCEFVTIFISQFTRDDAQGKETFQARNTKILLNWYVMPEAVHPQSDDRFVTQEWKDRFVESDSIFFFKESSATVSLDEACDIIRFCFRLTNIKAFW